METIYKCEICGYESENKKKVQKCEARGRKNKFSINEKVDARVAGIGGFVIVKARVRKVLFQKRTHKAVYNLTRDGKLPEGIGRIFCSVAENQLSSG